MASFLPLRIRAEKWGYQHLAKPLFFRSDPEDVHDQVSAVGEWIGHHSLPRSLLRSFFQYEHPALAQDILGIHFSNPIGLSAGFDKNARLIPTIAAVGFGFEEIGSVTGEPCAGNPRPRLWRLPHSQGLAVYYGLNNNGCDAVAAQLSGQHSSIPIGVSIAKTNCQATADEQCGIEDYVKAYRTFATRGIGSYFTFNISCPNAFGGQPFTDPDSLDRLLAEIKKTPSATPIFLKLPPDLSEETLDRLILVARKHRIHGFICTNLTKRRDLQHIKDPNVPEHGGLSGKIVEGLSNHILGLLYQKTGREFVLIGTGGVFSADDAYQKIRLGASLIQLITGMIFEGPQLIHEIKRGLVALLARDGYARITDAVGSAFSKPSKKNSAL